MIINVWGGSFSYHFTIYKKYIEISSYLGPNHLLTSLKGDLGKDINMYIHLDALLKILLKFVLNEKL